MQSLARHRRSITRLGAVAVACLSLSACTLQNQSAPGLTGPSGYGQVLTLTATPDTLPRDGSSQSVVRVNYRDGSTNEPLAQKRLVLSASAGTLSVPEVVTDQAGNASFTLIAPGLNTPATSAVVGATVVGEDAANAVSTVVQVALIGPDVPTAAFTYSPATVAVFDLVTFDASSSKLYGAACDANCSYAWDFGDGTTGSGQIVQHVFQTGGVMTVTLTVTSPLGTSAVATKSVLVGPPTAPVADFSVTPSSPAVGVPATFNGLLSSVGAGASITLYTWNFGDNSPSVTGSVVTHAFAASGPYPVTLTVTDSLGRQARKLVTITVP